MIINKLPIPAMRVLQNTKKYFFLIKKMILKDLLGLGLPYRDIVQGKQCSS